MEMYSGELYSLLSPMDKAHLDTYPAEWYRENNCKCWKVVINGFVAGVFAITGEGELVTLILSPEHQGKGYGKKIMNFAVEKGARFLFAFEDLIPFYARSGFSVTHFIKWDSEQAPKTWDYYAYPHGMDLVFMSLVVTPYPWPRHLGRVYSNYNLARLVVSRNKSKYENIATAFTLRNGSNIHVFDNRKTNEGIEAIVYNGHGGKSYKFDNLETYVEFFNLPYGMNN